jgi:hypothetical protein
MYIDEGTNKPFKIKIKINHKDCPIKKGVKNLKI